MARHEQEALLIIAVVALAVMGIAKLGLGW